MKNWNSGLELQMLVFKNKTGHYSSFDDVNVCISARRKWCIEEKETA